MVEPFKIIVADSYAASLRLMSPASPASPLPSSRKLDGSGVAVVSALPRIWKEYE
jgi:hypothetical protein